MSMFLHCCKFQLRKYPVHMLFMLYVLPENKDILLSNLRKSNYILKYIIDIYLLTINLINI